VKVSRDRWQFELKIVRRLTPDLGGFEKALEGPFPILSKWYRLRCRRRTPRSSRAITAFPFQTREAALPMEEIVYLTLEELIKIHRKKHYVIFFET